MKRHWFYVKNHFWNFHKIFTFWDPLSKKNGFYESVYLFVCRLSGICEHDNSWQDDRILLRICILYLSPKSKDEFIYNMFTIYFSYYSEPSIDSLLVNRGDY